RLRRCEQASHQLALINHRLSLEVFVASERHSFLGPVGGVNRYLHLRNMFACRPYDGLRLISEFRCESTMRIEHTRARSAASLLGTDFLQVLANLVAARGWTHLYIPGYSA